MSSNIVNFCTIAYSGYGYNCHYEDRYELYQLNRIKIQFPVSNELLQYVWYYSNTKIEQHIGKFTIIYYSWISNHLKNYFDEDLDVKFFTKTNYSIRIIKKYYKNN